MSTHLDVFALTVFNLLPPCIAAPALGWPVSVAMFVVQMLGLFVIRVWLNQSVSREVARIEAKYRDLYAPLDK